MFQKKEKKKSIYCSKPIYIEPLQGQGKQIDTTEIIDNTSYGGINGEDSIQHNPKIAVIYYFFIK